MIRRFFNLISIIIIYLLMPIKMLAYWTRFLWIRRIITTITNPIDFLLIFFNISNETMLLHAKAYRGNFLFGRSVMLVDYDDAVEAIQKPLFKNNSFMGVNMISANPDVFSINTGILNQSPPMRAHTRKYIDTILTERIKGISYEELAENCSEIMEEWKNDPKMKNPIHLRGTATRIFLKLLSGVTITKKDGEFVTFQYSRRFAEITLFTRYFTFMMEFLGSSKYIRKDAYFKLLKEYGINNVAIDMTLFAAMFSVGTLVIRCTSDLRKFKLKYKEMNKFEKMKFIIEAVRLYPTVSTVHRVVEDDETVTVMGMNVKLTAGDEVNYPFICSNRDKKHFSDPLEMKLDRDQQEYDKVISWSKGPHACPAKDLSINVTMLMLDTLAERYELETLKIMNTPF